MKAPQSPWPLRTAAGRTIGYYSVQIPDPLERLRFLRKCMEVTGEYIPLVQRRPFCVWLYRKLFLTTVAEGSRISSPTRGRGEGRLLELFLRRNHLPRRVAGILALLCLVIWFLVGVALTCRHGASATLEAAQARTEERGPPPDGRRRGDTARNSPAPEEAASRSPRGRHNGPKPAPSARERFGGSSRSFAGQNRREPRCGRQRRGRGA